jgi:ligand-binding sensor domain-containing protein/signal transduction histidine kinase
LLRNLRTSRNRGKQRRWLFSLVIAVMGVVYFAANTRALDPQRTLREYLLERWGVERGFPGGTVLALAQSGDGYLWIGTDRGLSRFDGVNFRSFPQAGQLPFAVGPVQSLTTDSDGNLWILLQSTRILRYRHGRFELVRDEAEFGVTALGHRKNGALLLSSLTYGALTYDGAKFHILQPPRGDAAGASARQDNDTLSSRLSWDTSLASHHIAEPNAAATSVAESSDGKVWLGTRDKGLFSMAEGRVFPASPPLSTGRITCLLPWRNSGLWIGTDDGILLWDGARITTAGVPLALRHGKVLAITRDRDSNVWVGTDRGLLRVNETGPSLSAEQSALINGPVNALFEDRENNVWVGTARGIERLRDGAFVNYSLDGAKSASGGPVYVDGEGRAWFAPFEGGLRWSKDGKTETVSNDGLSRDVVYSITGGDNELWIGRQQSGLTRLRYHDGKVTTRTYKEADGLPQNGVYAVYRSKNGSVWAATLSGGVSEYSNDHFTIYSRKTGMSSDTVLTMAESPDGTMWFGTSNGLNALSNGQWRVLTARDGLPSDNVNCLLLDSGGVLWIGTASGLAFLEAGHVQRRNDASDLLHESILGMAEDPQRRLWIATTNHILSLNRDRLLGGEFQPADVRVYALKDGLQGTEGVKRQASVVADRLGRVWISTNRGVSLVDTARVDNLVPPIVQVEGLLLDGNAMNLQQPVRIPPGRHRVTFTYSGLSLSVPERVRFRYELEGFDQGWSQPTPGREAVYTNLGPGSYRFRVMASNATGIWNGAEMAVPFELASAFWQTWWFRLCCVLIVALMVLIFLRLRVRRITNQMKVRFEERLAERTRIAQELHDTLLQGVISVSMQLHVVADQIPADSAAKPALNRILNLMGRVTEDGRSAVAGLRSLENSSTDLGHAFSEIHQQFDPQNHIGFQVIAEGSPRSIHPMIRDEIYSIGREALTNAFRHAHASKMEVELQYATEALRVLVRDNGLGFDSEMLQHGRDGHWGLSGMRERAKRINAKLRVMSRPSAGTEVELSVPGQVAFMPKPANGTSKWWSKVRPHWKQTIERSSSEYER